MPKLVSDWKHVLRTALFNAGIITSDEQGYSGKIIISVVDGCIKFVEMSQTVK